MSITLLVGLAVVAVSALIFYPLMFGRRPEPATVRVSNSRATPQRSQVAFDEHDDIRPRWWQRLRSAGSLLAVTLALAAALATVLGLVVLAMGIALQR
jgi:hypothetical protein